MPKIIFGQEFQKYAEILTLCWFKSTSTIMFCRKVIFNKAPKSLKAVILWLNILSLQNSETKEISLDRVWALSTKELLQKIVIES